MGGCAVPGCKSRSEVNNEYLRFFSVPAIRKKVPIHSQRRSERRRALWLSKIGKRHLMYEEKYPKICSRHFLSGKPAAFFDESSPDWGPSANLSKNDPLDCQDIAVTMAKPESNRQIDPLDLQDIAVTMAKPESNRQIDPLDLQDIAVTRAEPESHRPVGTQEAGSYYESCMHIKVEDSSANFEIAHHEVLCSNPEHFKCTLSLKDNSDSGMKETVRNDSDVCKNMEHDGLVSTYSDCFSIPSVVDRNVKNSTTSNENISEQYNKLQAEYGDVVRSHSKLRDKLTDAEVDKLELLQAMAAANEKCEDYARKCEALESESMLLRAKVEQFEPYKKDVQEQLKIAELKIRRLEAKLEKVSKCLLSLERLQEDDSLVCYYTGLPSYSVFKTVLTLVMHKVIDRTRSLEPWQCLLLTVMRLRLGLKLRDLAYRFGISTSVASGIFEKWLHHLYVHLEPCINWPDRETLYKTMPNLFKAEFGKSIAIIVDYLELCFDGSDTLHSKVEMWSDYNYHNTVSFLIGMTPMGAVYFISSGWGGRVSDKHMTACSDLYEKLMPHDVVLDDQGFIFGDHITDKYKLSASGLHVKKLMGLVKNQYEILKTTFHCDFLVVKPRHKVPEIDKVVRVCCALTNFSRGQVCV